MLNMFCILKHKHVICLAINALPVEGGEEFEWLNSALKDHVTAAVIHSPQVALWILVCLSNLFKKNYLIVIVDQGKGNVYTLLVISTAAQLRSVDCNREETSIFVSDGLNLTCLGRVVAKLGMSCSVDKYKRRFT